MKRLLALFLTMNMVVALLPLTPVPVYAFESNDSDSYTGDVDDYSAESIDSSADFQLVDYLEDDYLTTDTDEDVIDSIDYIDEEAKERSYAASTSGEPLGVSDLVLGTDGYYSYTQRDGSGYSITWELYDSNNPDVPMTKFSYDLQDNYKDLSSGSNLIEEITKSGTYYLKAIVKNNSSGTTTTTTSTPIAINISNNKAPVPELLDCSVSMNRCAWTSSVDVEFYRIEVQDEYGESYQVNEYDTDEYHYWDEDRWFTDGLSFRFRTKAMVKLDNKDYCSSDWSDWNYEFWDSYEETSQIDNYFDQVSLNEDGNGLFTFQWKDLDWAKAHASGSFYIARDGQKIFGDAFQDPSNQLIYNKLINSLDFKAAFEESGKYYVQIKLVDKETGKLLTDSRVCEFDYSKPEKRVSAPSNISWKGKSAKFEGPAGYDRYFIVVYKNGQSWTKYPFVKSSSDIVEVDLSGSIDMDPSASWQFRVYTLPNNNTQESISDYSESPVWDYVSNSVTKLTLNKTSFEAKSGYEWYDDLKVAVSSNLPSVSGNRAYNLSVESSNPDVIYIDEDNAITPNGDGTYTIAFRTNGIYGTSNITVRSDNGKQAICKVTVPKISTKSVIFEKRSITIEPGNIVAVSGNAATSRPNNLIAAAKITPDNSNDLKQVYLESSNPDIVKVIEGGLRFEAVSSGYAKITEVLETIDKRTIRGSIDVYVNAPVESITITPLSGGNKIFKGYSGKLLSTIKPANALLTDINWISSNSAISIKAMPGTNQASFSAIHSGDSEITATVGSKSNTYTISVVDQINVHYADGETADGAVSAAYGEPLEGIRLLGVPSNEDKVFVGWYTQPDGKGQRVTENTLAKDQFDIYAYWEDATHEMRVRPIEDGNYTGTAIKPVVEVYDGQSGEILVEKKDYTVSYKNNTKAWVRGNNAYPQTTDNNGNYTKAPTVTITGKGNYAGKRVIAFNIYPADINGADFTADDIAVAYNAKKVQQAKPVIKRGSKTLGKNDVKIVYKNSEAVDAFKAPGVYEIELTGIGNYSGTRIIRQRITNNVLISKSTVKLNANQDLRYTGNPVEPTFTVKSGSTELRDGTDYSIAFDNNIEVGTATAIITGKGDYAGIKKVTFKITGERIDKAIASAIPDQIYKGFEIEPEVSLTSTDGKPISVNDYEVSYSDNIKPGKATATIIGKNRYKGTSKKVNFKILTCPMTSEGICVSVSSNSAEYSKAGARPSGLTVKHWDVELTEGVDYTVVCKNNNKLTDDATATLVVKGKGRYVGESKTFHYSVVKKSIVLSGNRAIKMTVPDKIAKSGKAGVYKSTPTLTDNGKKLSSSDYDANGIIYTYSLEQDNEISVGGGRTVRNGDEVYDTDIIPAGTSIKVVVPAKEGSNYTGNAEKTYRVVEQDISKASVGKIIRYYTGEEIEFKNAEDFEDWKVTIKGVAKPLKYGEDYYIVPESYEKNINKGTAKVTIRGIGNYGGTKTVSFTIATRNITDK